LLLTKIIGLGGESNSCKTTVLGGYGKGKSDHEVVRGGDVGSKVPEATIGTMNKAGSQVFNTEKIKEYLK